MNVSSVNDALNAGQLIKQAREHKNEQIELQTVPKPPEIESDEGEQGETGRARGVIRLLESGHFKGVADVRLRINFFDELSARANASAVPVARENASQLVSSVNGQVDELLGQLELDEETSGAVGGLREEFDAAVQTAVDEATGEGRVDTAALGESLSAAFASFSQQLSDLLAPLMAAPEPEEPDVVLEIPEDTGPAEQPVEGEEPLEGPDEPPEGEVVTAPIEGEVEPPGEELPQDTAETAVFDLAAAITNMNEAFGEALAGFLDSIEEAAQLPPLASEPSGNGKAYAKFLEIYNEMIGLGPSVVEDPQESSEPEITEEDIDLTA